MSPPSNEGTMTKQTFTLTENVNAERKIWEKRAEYELKNFLLRFHIHDERPNKDGACFLPGLLHKNQRLARHVVQINSLVYDIDGEQTIQEVIPLIDNLGVVAVAYSSHSNMTTRTTINADTISTWLKKSKGIHDPDRDVIPTFDDMIAYLAKFKPYFKPGNPKFDPSDKAYQGRDDKGKCYYLHHDPIQKFRIVFPLKTPIEFDSLGASSGIQLRIYSSIYHGVGRAVGLMYDESCSDPSRLFYFPSTPDPKNAFCAAFGLPDDWQENFPENPKLLDYNDYPRVNPKEEREEGTVVKNDVRVTDKNNNLIDLRSWGAANYDFDIEELLERTLPEDMLRGRRTRGGITVACPFEDENHTKTAEVDMGAFAANGNGSESWVIHCSHTSCKTVHNRRRLDYLKGYIQAGYITAEDLGIKTPASVVNRISNDTASAELGVPAHTLPKELLLPPPPEDESDEEEIALDAPVVPSDEDSAIPEDVFYEQCLRDITNCNDYRRIRKLLDRLKARGCTLIYEDIIEVLAKSEAPFQVLRKLAKLLELRVDGFAELDFLKFAREYRTSAENIGTRVSRVVEGAASSEKNAIEYARIADYYGVSRHEVRSLAETLVNETARQKSGDELAIQMTDLRSEWGRIKQGTDSCLIGMKRSRQDGTPFIYTEAGFKKAHKTRIVEVKKSKKGKEVFEEISVADEWLKYDKLMQTFDGVTFLPKGAPIVDNKFNIWSEDGQYTISPRKGDCSRIIDHIREVWCDNDEYLTNWTLMWIADIFQNPEVRPMTALLVTGDPGTGKSIICDEILGPILGKYYGKSAKRDNLVGKFNSMLQGKLLWLAEETLFAGDRQSMQIIKDMITSPSIMIEPKGIDAYQYPSYTRFMFTSNMLHALHLEEKDRRFVVYRTTNKYMQNTEHFDKLKAWLDKEGRAFFLDYLLNFKPEDHGLTWGELRRPPMTEAKRAQVEMSFDTADEFFLDILRHGRVMGMDDENQPFTSHVRWGLFEEDSFIDPTSLRQNFEQYLARKVGVSAARYDRNKFSSLLKKYILNGGNMRELRTTRWVDKKPQNVIKLPPREKAIEAAIKERYLCEEDLINARNNPDSHREGDFNNNR